MEKSDKRTKLINLKAKDANDNKVFNLIGDLQAIGVSNGINNSDEIPIRFQPSENILLSMFKRCSWKKEARQRGQQQSMQPMGVKVEFDGNTRGRTNLFMQQ